MEPYVVAIAGPSCAGKTTLARALLAARRAEGSLLSLDSYYRDLSHLSAAERAVWNFDEPAALDWEVLRHHVHLLAQGETVEVPTYDFASHTRRPETSRLVPGGFVIVEGLFALCDEAPVETYGTAVYVDLREDSCLARRLDRDTRERGRTADSVRRQYEQTVLPMARLHIEPTRARADVVVVGSTPVEEAAERVLEHIRRAAAPARRAKPVP